MFFAPKEILFNAAISRISAIINFSMKPVTQWNVPLQKGGGINRNAVVLIMIIIPFSQTFVVVTANNDILTDQRGGRGMFSVLHAKLKEGKGER